MRAGQAEVLPERLSSGQWSAGFRRNGLRRSGGRLRNRRVGERNGEKNEGCTDLVNYLKRADIAKDWAIWTLLATLKRRIIR